MPNVIGRAQHDASHPREADLKRTQLAASTALVTLAAALMPAAWAVPFVPANDSIVLEHLPEAGDSAARALRAQHRALSSNPHDLSLALDVARGDLGLAREMGDPRFLGRAEAALAPWPPSPQAPADVMLLRAIILQSNHDFPGALADLAQTLHQKPNSAQAWLTEAAIHQAQADYKAALADCGQFASMAIGLAPDICTASAMTLTGHAPLALHAVALSFTTNAAEAVRSPGIAMWGLTLAAETADRLDDPSAESWFRRALVLDPHDPYLLGAWSDYLLDHHRPQEVIALLTNSTRIDPLLLRLALAEQATSQNKAEQATNGNTAEQATDEAPQGALAGHIADLGARFEASRLRGETVHRREEARFELQLMHHRAQALVLAQANWTVQREPADARILLEAALATGQPAAAMPALDWLRGNAVQDVRLQALATRLATTPPTKS